MKKIRQILQQLNPFSEHVEPEKPAVSVNPVQPSVIEPVKVGEIVEAMIQEEYLSQKNEVYSGNIEDTAICGEQLLDALILEQDISVSLQKEESILLTEKDAHDEESKDLAFNFSPESENTEPVQLGEETVTFPEKEIESEISTTEESIQEPTLSDNRPFVKLAEECAGLMNEFDGYNQRLETEEGKMMVELLVKRMQELLERAGLERIDNENEPFSILKHKPDPMMPVAEGATLREIISPGLAIENRVFRKAKVLI
jgi:molecular chaperone GrpE (heat shock protein)